MKIIIVGAGEVGTYLSETLSRAGHDVTVLERSEELAHKLDEELDVRSLRENGSSARALVKAGVDRCDYFLAMTSDDETNIVSSSLAKALGARNTFARVHDQTYRDTSVINYQVHFGIDHLVNPERLAAVEIAKAIRNPGRVAVEDFGRGQVEVQSMEVRAGAKVIGKSLAELRLNPKMRVGLVQRGDAAFVATASTLLEAGDGVTVVGPPDILFEVRSQFEPGSDRDRQLRVAILGGGEIGVSLVRLLTSPRFKIRIIERDYNLCKTLSERFPHVTIIHGEGTSLRLLEEEQIGGVDFFVACTKDDEDNVMTCLQASKLGAKHVILAINRADYIEVLTNLKATLGVETAVSPRVATANEVLRYISKEPYIELARLPGGAASIIELKVAEKSECDGRALKEVRWPSECVIVVLLHKFEARTPGAGDVMFAGDRLVAVVRQEVIPDLLKLTS
jgi:trk system potassium uptake protein